MHRIPTGVKVPCPGTPLDAVVTRMKSSAVRRALTTILAATWWSPLNPSGFERFRCNDGTGGPCIVGDVCCINSVSRHFCCEQKCKGDFCGQLP